MGFLLRLLLSLALVLNGTSGAWAMAGAADARPTLHAGHAMATDAVPPCHQDADTAAPTRPAPAPDDCCETAACQCACAHLPAAAFAVELVPSAPAPGTTVATGVASGHPAPPLPHRTRPPIG